MGEIKIKELREEDETTLVKFQYSNSNRLVCRVTWKACAYKMGGIKIKELREKGETTLVKFTYSNSNRIVCHVACTGLCI